MSLTTNTKTEETKQTKKSPESKPQKSEKKETVGSVNAGAWVAIGVATLIALLMLVAGIRSAYVGRGTHFGGLSLNKAEAEDIAEEPTEEPTEEATEEAMEVASAVEVPAETTEMAMVATETVTETVEAEAFDETPEVTYNWHFYNADIQDNGVAADDFNFGPNPVYENLDLEQVKKAISGKAPSDSVKVESLISAAETMVMDQDFRDRMRNDPALGAADMAWFDSLVGTRYLGVFYDECDEKWDATMNAAKEAWMEDGEDYNKTLDAFFAYLDSATKVEVKSLNKRLSDQMYMNPYTKNGVPDIIVLKTDDHSGWYLTYTFTIKETKTVEVMYRIDCGYQPTDVAKVMNVTAKKKSTVTGGGGTVTGGGGTVVGGGGIISGGGGNGGSGGGGGGTPPGPGPGNTPKKDPTKGTPVLPNDDKGPGENTNTGKGGQYSSKDQVGNSNDLTPGEYKDTIGEIGDANKNTGGGGDGSTPSTPVSSGTTTDNPGSSDSGHTDTSGSSVDHDDSGDSWDGPPE